jgi:hypothetical protein
MFKGRGVSVFKFYYKSVKIKDPGYEIKNQELENQRSDNNKNSRNKIKNRK